MTIQTSYIYCLVKLIADRQTATLTGNWILWSQLGILVKQHTLGFSKSDQNSRYYCFSLNLCLYSLLFFGLYINSEEKCPKKKLHNFYATYGLVVLCPVLVCT